MPRITTFKLVVLLPLLASIALFAWAEYRRRFFREAYARFRTEQTENGFLHLAHFEMPEGTEKTRTIIGELARHEENLIFDGDSRCAQLIPAGLQNQHADGIAMYSLGSHHVTKCIYGLNGTRIRSMRFKGDNLVIECYGKIEFGNRLIRILESGPEEYRIRWPENSQVPSDQEIHDVMRSRFDADNAAPGQKESGDDTIGLLSFLSANDGARRATESILGNCPRVAKFRHLHQPS